MNKYEVGYGGEFIGVYSAESQEEAIQECKQEISNSDFNPDTSAKDRVMGGMIANLITE